MKKLLSLLLSAILALGCLGICASAADDPGHRIGNIIEFGSYPQSKVTDEAIISKLESKSANAGWISYNYYDGSGERSDYMRYKDVELDDEKYRAVTFDSYRPVAAGEKSESFQQQNGYSCGKVYWFRFETLKWKILDPDEGLMLCETVIDSQPFTNFIEFDYENDTVLNENGAPATDWSTSALREWLNGDFYACAFSDAEKDNIKTRTNKQIPFEIFAADAAYLKGFFSDKELAEYRKLAGNSKFEDTRDRVFVLSDDEVTNEKYGFVPASYDKEFRADLMLAAHATDYAESQGLFAFTLEEYYDDKYFAEDEIYSGFEDYFRFVHGDEYAEANKAEMETQADEMTREWLSAMDGSALLQTLRTPSYEYDYFINGILFGGTQVAPAKASINATAYGIRPAIVIDDFDFEEQEEQSFFEMIIEAIKNFFDVIVGFFRNLFN